MTTLQVEDGYKETTPRGTIPFARGKLIAPPGVAISGLAMIIGFQLTATAADAGGLTAADQRTLLDDVTLTFKEALSAGKAARTKFDKESLTDIERDTMRLLERTVIGGVASTTGLQAALVEGANTIYCTVSFSTGHIEFIDEAPKFAAMSPEQLADCEFVLKTGSLALVDGNVTVTGVTLDLRIIQGQKSEGRRECIMPEVLEVKGGQEDGVEGPDGLTLSAEQMTSALSATNIATLTVEVGGVTVTKDPATPVDIQAQYDRDPNTGATEKTLATVRTPLYLVADSPVAKLRVGPVKITMDAHDEDLEVRFLHLPLLTHTEVMARIVQAATLLGNKETIHAVNTAEVENIEAPHDVLPFLGWQYFTEEDPRFHSTVGIRCKNEKGAEPYVHVPTGILVKASTEYNLALSDKSTEAAPAAQGGAAAVIESYGRKLPGFVTSTKGFKEGGMSEVGGMLKTVITTAGTILGERTTRGEIRSKKKA